MNTEKADTHVLEVDEAATDQVMYGFYDWLHERTNRGRAFLEAAEALAKTLIRASR